MKAELINRETELPTVPVQELLTHVLTMDASDLHLTVGAKPTVRIHGDLKPLEQYDILEPDQVRRMVYAILTQRQRERLEQDLELDMSYSLPGRARFRVNVYFQRDAVGAAFRFIPFTIRTVEDLGLPPQVSDFARLPRGLVLVTGPTGSGKSTTLHTQDAPQTIDRIIDAFPPHQQQQIRVQLSTTLQGVVTQQLLQTWDGQGRVVAAEVMVTTPAIRNLIREAKVHQIYSSMQAGGQFGMRVMDQALAYLVTNQKITMELARQRCHDPQELQRLAGGGVARGGRSG